MASLAPEYPIRTERLLLRPLTLDDLDDLHAYMSRPDVCRYIPPVPRSREELAERFDNPQRCRTTLDGEDQALQLGLELDGRMIGDCLLFYRSVEHHQGEIGYVLNPDFHGHGYMTEAADAMLALGFDGLGLHRIMGRTDARNTASHSVLRRLGMRQEAVLRENEWFKGEWTDEIDFAILESEWRLPQFSSCPSVRPNFRSEFGRTEGQEGNSGQGGGEIGNQVIGVLDADRQPHQLGRHLQR
jgi:RimJ/RimL family protein N-acetyltransferase